MNSFVLKTFTPLPCRSIYPPLWDSSRNSSARFLSIFEARLPRLAAAPRAVVGDAETGFEDAAVGLERGAGGLMDDGAALQDHCEVGDPEDLLRALLHQDRRHALVADQAGERGEQFF